MGARTGARDLPPRPAFVPCLRREPEHLVGDFRVLSEDVAALLRVLGEVVELVLAVVAPNEFPCARADNMESAVRGESKRSEFAFP